MSEAQIQEINHRLAKDFIEERLDALTTENNIQRLATCIQEIENTG